MITPTDLERQVAATMWLVVEKPRMAERAMAGKLDDHPGSQLIQSLAKYRADFIHNASFNLIPDERYAMKAAAEYYEQKPNTTGALIFAPGLRKGFLYPNDYFGRAFMLLHRLLIRNHGPVKTRIASNRP